MSKTKVTRKYQITIPKNIREALRINIGDTLKIKVEGNKIILEPVKPIISNPIEYLSSLSKEQMDVDAVKLVKESWDND
jgi:AbrB family looped-hinge helix DNA binding protein